MLFTSVAGHVVLGVVARKADKAVQTGSQADFGIGRTDGQTQSAESSRAA